MFINICCFIIWKLLFVSLIFIELFLKMLSVSEHSSELSFSKCNHLCISRFIFLLCFSGTTLYLIHTINKHKDKNAYITLLFHFEIAPCELCLYKMVCKNTRAWLKKLWKLTGQKKARTNASGEDQLQVLMFVWLWFNLLFLRQKRRVLKRR